MTWAQGNTISELPRQNEYPADYWDHYDGSMVMCTYDLVASVDKYTPTMNNMKKNDYSLTETCDEAPQ